MAPPPPKARIDENNIQQKKDASQRHSDGDKYHHQQQQQQKSQEAVARRKSYEGNNVPRAGSNGDEMWERRKSKKDAGEKDAGKMKGSTSSLSGSAPVIHSLVSEVSYCHMVRWTA